MWCYIWCGFFYWESCNMYVMKSFQYVYVIMLYVLYIIQLYCWYGHSLSGYFIIPLYSKCTIKKFRLCSHGRLFRMPAAQSNSSQAQWPPTSNANTTFLADKRPYFKMWQWQTTCWLLQDFIFDRPETTWTIEMMSWLGKMAGWIMAKHWWPGPHCHSLKVYRPIIGVLGNTATL